MAHQPDEYIGIQDMIDSSHVMGKTLANLLVGLTEPELAESG